MRKEILTLCTLIILGVVLVLCSCFAFNLALHRDPFAAWHACAAFAAAAFLLAFVDDVSVEEQTK